MSLQPIVCKSDAVQGSVAFRNSRMGSLLVQPSQSPVPVGARNGAAVLQCWRGRFAFFARGLSTVRAPVGAQCDAQPVGHGRDLGDQSGQLLEGCGLLCVER
jgi:hypothetical protein